VSASVGRESAGARIRGRAVDFLGEVDPPALAPAEEGRRRLAAGPRAREATLNAVKTRSRRGALGLGLLPVA
jgi:hypothetical protein